MNDRREDRLGTALRELPTPKHRPGFWEGVNDRIGGRPIYRNRMAWLTVAASFAALALIAGLMTRTGPGVTENTIATGTGGALAVSGTFVIRGEGPGGLDSGKAWSFDRQPDGTVAVWEGDLDAFDQREGLATRYSAETRSQRTRSTGEDGTSFYAEHLGLGSRPAPGPNPFIDIEFAQGVVGAALGGDPRVSMIDHDGRPAWKMIARPERKSDAPDAVDEIELVVDRKTHLPMLHVHRRAGRPVYEMRTEATFHESDGQAWRSPAQSDVEFPSGAEVNRTDHGFSEVARTQAGPHVSYTPLETGWLPPGYEYDRTLVGRVDGGTGPEEVNPPMRDVVQLTYRRGFAEVNVTTWLRRSPGAASGTWVDPLSYSEGTPWPESSETADLASGYFAGSDVQTTVDIHAVPRLFAVGEQLVLTVSGPLPRKDLIRIAESLS